MVEDGHDGEEPLQVRVAVGVLADDVGVGVEHADHVPDLLLGELLQLAVVPDEVHDEVLPLGLRLLYLEVVHEHVELGPGVGLVVPQPEHPDDHDGVVPGARLVEVLDDEARAARAGQQAALPRVVALLQLAVRAAQGHAAVPTPATPGVEGGQRNFVKVSTTFGEGSYSWSWRLLPVYQHGQPLVAVETHRLGVGVGAHGAGLVGEEDLARHDVPRGDEQAAAPLLVADPVGGGVGHPGHPRSVTGHRGGGAFTPCRGRAVAAPRPICRLSRCYEPSLLLAVLTIYIGPGPAPGGRPAQLCR